MNWHLFFVIVSLVGSLIWPALAVGFYKCFSKPGQSDSTATGAAIGVFACLAISFLSLTALVCLLIP